ncbi:MULTISPECIES: FAD/NAD(P)-binding oxidoreductase [Archaeoglobus]|jgi:sulfide:quinone oxidoreductase|uniref:Flavoprotein reductase n=1 Tax=Archaeoglobus fulgidus TaxID=2234 RepID=A0A101DBT0_ARCFL|nr:MULTISPECIES: FAD/NAD(P)-binding oxidoreductase [Archaeoglobus]KUJ92657.1 MAG: Flavoprotein reductase [Archaeoglobus fulgidus]KUK05876.1 MAG: Flavoprotein reductase [Archaeoglobus fulgidus]MDI3498495.1 sulfide:quinone oxidoreductase [Archaeoglobus sp.]
MKNIVVLGGGVAGTITANYLAMKLREEIREKNVSITLISDREKQLYEPGLLYLIFNRMEESEILKDVKYLLDPLIELKIARATKIDAEKSRVELENGEVVNYDYLVIATGSRVAPEEMPGLVEGGHWFYNLDGARRLREELARFKKGKVVVSVMGIPHKCPVAPIEVTFMLHEFFKIHGVRKDVELLYTYPINRVFTMEEVSDFVQKMFDERGINYKTFFNPVSIDPEKKVIETLEGEEETYDLLIAIPPHKGSQVIIDSGLGDRDGWVPTDRYTLKAEGLENVYVVGDATNLPVSKAGSVAHFEAEVVAENIAAEIKGLPPTARYFGKAMCFIETGFSEATYIWFDYETPPKFVKPNKFIHWMKLAYNRMYWLTARGML